MRFFIALELPETNKLQLKSLQAELKNIIPQARLTNNSKLHLTIAFIGEEDPRLKGGLVEVIRKAAEAQGEFEVTPAYIDGFPNIHYPHTLWVGVKGDIDKLLLIREKVKDNLLKLNLEVDERRFIPHIAIAKLVNFRITQEQEVELEKLMAKNFSPIRVSSIKLFESIPDEGFHRHNTLAEIPLVG